MDHELDINIFNELEKVTNTGCWKYDVITQKLWWSLQTYKIHCVDPSVDLTVSMAISFFHIEDQDAIKLLFEKCISEAKSYKDHFRIIDNEGNLRYVECNGKATLSDGIVSSVYGTFKDISKDVFILKKRRDVSLELEHNFQMLNNFFIVAMTNEYGKITFVNDKFCEISGYSREELIGQDHRLLNSGYHSKEFFQHMWSTIKSGASWQGLIKNLAKNGDDYWVQTFIFPKFNNFNEKKITGYIALRFDVTYKVKLEQDLKDEREKLELSAQLASIGEVSAGIAHEIANPLTIISAAKEILKRNITLTDTTQKNIDSISEGVKRIDKIMNGLHHLAQKSRAAEHELQDVADIVDYTFEFCEEALKSKGIKIIYDNQAKNSVILCDEIKVSQVLLNLINNARDAIENLSEKWIKIILSDNEQYLKLSVVDSGNGIPKEIRDKVLSSFFTTKEVGKGTGLGLSLVKRFIEEHEGQLRIVEDTTNTEFEVILPRRK